MCELMSHPNIVRLNVTNVIEVSQGTGGHYISTTDLTDLTGASEEQNHSHVLQLRSVRK